MNLEEEIKKIKERNKRVELDKSWETSWTRKNMYYDINLYCCCIIFSSY